MKLLLELSGEHAALARAEVCAVLEAENIDATIEHGAHQLAVITTSQKKYEREKAKKALIARMAHRLSFTHYINEVLFDCEPAVEALESGIASLALEEFDGHTYCVRVRRVTKKSDEHSVSIEKRLGDVLGARAPETMRVNLKNPDVEFRAILADRAYFCRKCAHIDRGEFEKRKAKEKPFFHPTGLHPKLARLMVNLSRARQSDALLDPFCGTGSILIEAALMGIPSIGGDADAKMIEGCRINMERYGVRPDLHHGDVSTIFERIKEVGAIVTDPPYARASTTLGEPLDRLYERMFETFRMILQKNKYLVLALPDVKFINLGKRYFVLTETYEVRVHKSLTRYICVLKNEKSR